MADSPESVTGSEMEKIIDEECDPGNGNCEFKLILCYIRTRIMHTCTCLQCYCSG